ncbi:hypothetical protein ONE63_006621 [Megalurothrips usitatus]|uniref:Uncharacterized protein n=1 Tax=Megalurothrips usitatus TaxID=439358 RepID=A0AAV7Y0U7_9NEOP|nr:hypothetical protein ONE63_006621 [Megalurothrips usitatus]
MAFISVDSVYLKPALDEFTKLLAALVGPHGHSCLIRSPVDSVTLTSSSSRLISNIPVGSPLLQFALQCIRSQIERFGDGGLYCGILLSKLMIRLIDSCIPRHSSCSILSELQNIVLSQLRNSEQLLLSINLDSVAPLMAVAQSVLLSKRGNYEGTDPVHLAHINTQISLLVQAFLESEASIEKVVLCIRKKVDKQCLLNGVLYPCADEEHVVLKGMSWNSASLLLFSVMLTDKIDCKEKELPGVDYLQQGKAQFEAAEIFIEKAISCGINIVACQKVVHPTLILKMKRKGILVLQRLGKRMAEAVEILSGAVPVSNLHISQLDSLPQLKGSLKKVQHFSDNGGNFVFMEGAPGSGICTVLLGSHLLESCSELEIVAHQVLTALKQVIQDTAVCPGGGCTEMHLCITLWKEVHRRREDLCFKLQCSASQLYTVVKWFQEGLLLASGLHSEAGSLAFDSVYYHAWRGSHSKTMIVEATTCHCGLISSDAVVRLNGSWSIFTLEHINYVCTDLNDTAQKITFGPSIAGSVPVHDVCSSKVGAITVAVESAIAITDIGAIITS